MWENGVNGSRKEDMKRKNRTFKESSGPKIRIAVCSPCGGSGVSLIAGTLAYIYAEKGRSVSLTELGKPGFFHSLDLEKKFLLRGFTDYFAAAAKRKNMRSPEFLKAGKRNEWQGINWIVNPSAASPEQILEIMRLIYNAPDEYNILDCSSLAGDLLENVLAEADRIFIVLDPLPSRLLPCTDSLQRLRILFPEAALIVNKMNSGVHRGELEKFLGSAACTEVPAVSAETIYKAEYACVLPCTLGDGKQLIGSLKKHE